MKEVICFQINDSLKDRVDDAERGKVDSDHLNQILRSEKEELLDQKADLFNVSGTIFLLLFL